MNANATLAAAPLPYIPHAVRTPDGLAIAAQEWGNPTGPAILFIHGFSQSALCWERQVKSGLAREFRLLTYDIRGHGASDKPADPACYREGHRWADEVRAVIEQTALRRPVLVGWSYAGRIICDYLARHGHAALAGIVLVDAAVGTGRKFFGPGVRFMPVMASADVATNIAATRAFLRACFATQPEQAAFETMLAFNMMVPPAVRAAMIGRPGDYAAVLRRIAVPVLAVHGGQDAIVLPLMAQYTAETVSGAAVSLFAESGHAPFWEQPDRFNRELAGFVRGLAPSGA